MGVYQLARLEIILCASHQRIAVKFCTPEDPLCPAVELAAQHKDIVVQILATIFHGDWTPFFVLSIEEITVFFTKRQNKEVNSQIHQKNLVPITKTPDSGDLKHSLLKFARIPPDLLKISWEDFPEKILIHLGQKHALLPQDIFALFQTYSSIRFSRSQSLNSELKEQVLHFYPDLGAQYPRVYQIFSTLQWLFQTYTLYYFSPLGVFQDYVPLETAVWPIAESLGEKQWPSLSESNRQILVNSLQDSLADFTKNRKTISSTEIQEFIRIATPLLAPKIIRFNPDLFGFYFVSEDPSLHSRSEIEAIERNYGFSTTIQEKLQSIPPNKVHFISILHLPKLSLAELYGFSLAFHSAFHIVDREPSLIIIEPTPIVLSHEQNAGITSLLSWIVTRKPCSLVRFLDLGTM